MSLNLNRLVTKKDFIRVRHLLSLPYLQLLQQLSHQSTKNNNNKNAMQLNTLLLLSSRHQCKDLFELRHWLIQSQPYGAQANISKLLHKWAKITQSALSGKFNVFINKSASTKQQIVEYFVDVSSIVTQSKPTFTSEQSVSQLALQFCTFGLPEYYNIWGLPRKSKQELQQRYVGMVDALFEDLSAPSDDTNSLFQAPVNSLFPLELFNVTDQPLIRETYLKYLQSRLKLDHKTVAWLTRTGLPCNAYLSKWFKNLHWQQKQKSLVRNNQTDLQVCNSLFLIVRKIMGFPAYKPTHTQSELISLSKQIFTNIPLIKQMLHQVKQIGPDKALQSIHAILLNEILSQENKIEQRKEQLFNSFLLPTPFGLIGAELKQAVSQVIQCKLIRALLLKFHFFFVDPSQQNGFVSSIINSDTFCQWVQNCAHINDTLAEVIYLRDLVSLDRTKQKMDFHDEKLNKIIQKCNKQFKKAIKQIEGNDSTTKQTEPIALSQYVEDIEELLSGSSRFVYNSRTFSPSLSSKQSQSVSSSLLNDPAYLSSYSSAAVRQMLQSQLNTNIKLTVSQADRSASYPYFPDFSITRLSKRIDDVYIRSSINKQIRVKQLSPHQIIDIGDVKNIDEFLKVHKE